MLRFCFSAFESTYSDNDKVILIIKIFLTDRMPSYML